MPTYADVLPALRWRAKQLGANVTAEALARALGEVTYAEIPAKIWPSVRAFRRFRSDVRVNVARKYLGT